MKRLENKAISLVESDAEVIARVAAGETSALGTLYDRHRSTVVAFAARASGNEDAEDVTHATFLTVAKIAASYDGRLSARPWLLGIAAKTISHRRRAASRFTRFIAKLTYVAPTHDPGHAHEAQRELRKALALIAESKRMVLIMFEVEAMSGEEIALALSIPVGTVWTRLHAARRELRALLGEGEER